MSKKKKRTKIELKPLDYFCIIASVIISIMVAVSYHENPPFYTLMGATALICGVTNTVLRIRGYRINYIFATVEAFACFYTSWTNHFFGNALINLAFYAPTSMIGFYLWGKHSGKDKKVIARKLNPVQAIVTGAAFTIATLTLNLILTASGGESTLLDSAATVLVVFATVLSVLRFHEQWLFWLLSDIIQLIMWTSVNDPAILALRIFYPIASVYGYYNWKKLIKTPKIANKTRPGH